MTVPVDEPVPVPTPPTSAGGMSPQLRFLLAAACSVVLIAGVRAVSPVLNNVLIALLVAQMMVPIADWLRERGLRRGIAIGVTLGAVLALLVGVSYALGSSIAGLTASLPRYEEGLQQLRDRILARLASLGIDPGSVLSSELLAPGKFVGVATDIISWVAGLFGNGFLIFFLAAIMLAHFAGRDEPEEGEAVVVDPVVERVAAVTVDVRPYLRITALTGLLFSVVITVVLMILGVRYAVVWGVLAFFLNFVPQVGIILSWLPPALIALVVHGWSRAAMVIAAYTVINFVTDNIVKPRAMATGLNISFLAIILSLLFWGWVLGPAGAILSVPLTLALRRFTQQFDEPSYLPPARHAAGPS